MKPAIEKNMVKLIATDMDGTLLNQHHLVSAENARAIQEAQEQGIRVVVATGRSYREAQPVLQLAGIACPIICVNGAEIRTADGEIVKSVPLALEDYLAVEAVLREEGIYFEMYTNQGTFTNNRSEALRAVRDFIRQAHPELADEALDAAAERRFTSGELAEVGAYADLYREERLEIYKLWAFGDEPEVLARTAAKLQELPRVAVSSSARNNLEITHQDAQKGAALRHFAAQYQIGAEEIMAIGDNYNDLSMLSMAGFGVAMGNAEEDVKRVCSLIAPRNDQDGVAYAIRKWALRSQ